MKPQCQRRVTDSGSVLSRQCMGEAIGSVNGVAYCRVHSPHAINMRARRQSARWGKELAEREVERKAEEERDRRAALYPELVQALRDSITRQGAASMTRDGEHGNRFKRRRLDEITRIARDLLAKAGEPE